MTGASWIQLGLSTAILVIVFWVNLGSKWLRHYRMRRPFDVYFKLGPTTDAPTGTEVRLAPHSTQQIDIRVSPKLHFVQNEIIVGVGGDSEVRPKLVEMKNAFVKQGKNARGSPDDCEGHYIDYSDRYHIKERIDRTKGNKYAFGFIVKTYDPGNYPLTVEAMTDDGEGKAANQLILRVE